MASPETVPFPEWNDWWHSNPTMISLAAGAFAGMSAEAILFPLDCLKTRVQSGHGWLSAGGFKVWHLYRGCGTAILGSAPASAIFFSTYEFTKSSLAPEKGGNGASEGSSDLQFTGAVVLASVSGELAASCIRVPVDLVKQRLQAGYKSSYLLPMHRSIFLASFQATAMRDVTHSSLQYPIYEYLKLALAHWTGQSLPAWQAAACGSVAGVISATLTTPFDLLKTRLNLRNPPPPTGDKGCLHQSHALIAEEVREIYKSRGVTGFFSGAMYRASWMGLGGFVFLGSFEFAKDNLRMLTQKQKSEPLPRTNEIVPSPSVSFAAGLVAGVSVDVPLHPVDTLKTRFQAKEGFRASGGTTGLWSGLSAVLIMSVPGSAVFFVVYDQMQHLLETVLCTHMWREAVAASLADISACVVRVPCEVMKQRMQTRKVSSVPLSVFATMRSVSADGFGGFYAGFGATVTREVPFALLQMPLFEELKRRHPWAEKARVSGDMGLQGLIGMTSGGVAGAIAGMLTTPLDAAKTRIMLTAKRADRRGLLEDRKSVV